MRFSHSQLISFLKIVFITFVFLHNLTLIPPMQFSIIEPSSRLDLLLEVNEIIFVHLLHLYYFFVTFMQTNTSLMYYYFLVGLFGLWKYNSNIRKLMLLTSSKEKCSASRFRLIFDSSKASICAPIDIIPCFIKQLRLQVFRKKRYWTPILTKQVI